MSQVMTRILVTFNHLTPAYFAASSINDQLEYKSHELSKQIRVKVDTKGEILNLKGEILDLRNTLTAVCMLLVKKVSLHFHAMESRGA